MRSIILGALLVLSISAQAQVGLEGITSGRYEIRKVKTRRPASEESETVVTDSDGIKVHTLNSKELDEEKKRKDAEQLAVSEAQKKAVEKIEKQTNAKKPESLHDIGSVRMPEQISANAEQSVEISEPSIKEQAESLFSSKAQEIYNFYREQIHPDDTRNNRVELEVSPVIAYIDSQSNYSYRTYQSLFNGVKIKPDVWFTPRIGVTGQFMFSLGADVDLINSNRSRIPVKHEFVDLGLNFRTFFGVSRQSNSVELSILHSDAKMTVPSDNTSRSGLKSQGFGVGLKTRVPSSINYAWTMTGTFYPRLQHEESEAGALTKSGSSQESSRLGLEFGGEWKLSRENQILWNVGASVERNTFDGAAESADPHTGLIPSNVSVTKSLYLFSLGYRWGY
ncbi:MAG: hypothetical protein ACXWQ7_18970 [Bdellovibrio sp.]